VDILLVTPELSPFVRVGGIAEGVAGLGAALARSGHRVTAAIPWGGAARENARIEPGIEVIFVPVPGSEGVYGSDVDEGAGGARRFAAFARAVTELVIARERAGAPFDVVHAHEWPAAMVPYLLRERGSAARTVLTIHNLAFQGSFGAGALADLGLGREHFTPARLEHYGRVNYLKGGILAASVVTTVSPAYAREILGAEHGELLDGVLRTRERDLVGIVNGIDTEVWNPATDAAIAARYDTADARGKAICKEAVLRELGLAEGAGPLVVSLGRVPLQKGSDLLAEALPELVASGPRVAIAGEGDEALARRLSEAASRCAGRAAYVGRASEALAHRLIAGADLVVMPSRYEPCGLVQRYAQRYGAAPVARRTGGLADTIVDGAGDLATGTGFLFEEASAGALVGAVRRAAAAMELDAWAELRRRMMTLSLGWMPAARRYEAVYRSAPISRARALF
jgi:starch synthase